MTCEYCEAGDGSSIYPWYGKAPHHAYTGEFLAPELWLGNFQEDPDAEGLGTYTHCPFCTQKAISYRPVHGGYPS